MFLNGIFQVLLLVSLMELSPNKSSQNTSVLNKKIIIIISSWKKNKALHMEFSLCYLVIMS